MAETAGVGRVVWHELQSQDVGRSRVFYEELFGWRIEAPSSAWRALLQTQALAIGTLTKLPAPFGPTRWIAYVAVSDSRATAARATALGCRVIGSAEADGQRTTIVEDPLGARFGLLEGTHDRDGSKAGAAEPGCFCWDQLYTRSAARSFALYSELFGWSREADARVPAWSSMRVGHAPAAGLVQGATEVAARWLACVRVDNLQAGLRPRAAARGAGAGGPNGDRAGGRDVRGAARSARGPDGACAWSSQPE